MARTHFVHKATNQFGEALSNARVYLFKRGTATPITDTMYSAATAGSVLTNPLTTGAQGEVECWIETIAGVDVPGVITIRTDDNGDLALAAGRAGSFATFSEDRAVEARPDSHSMVVGVREYGADMTGAVNSSTALSDAHAALPAGGGTILIPPGTLLQNTSVTFTKPVKLVGAGTRLTTINRTAGARIVFSGAGASGSSVEGITFSGGYPGTVASHATAEAIALWNLSDVKVRGCRFLNNPTAGVSIASAEKVWITDCEFDNIRLSGVNIQGTSRHIWIERNYMEDVSVAQTAGTAGIQTIGGATVEHLWVRSNYIIRAGFVGIGVDAGENVWIEDNRVIDTIINEGIAFIGNRFTVARNRVSGSTKANILLGLEVVGQGNHNVIIDNECWGGDAEGIQVNAAVNNVVVDTLIVARNNCHDNGTFGFQSTFEVGVTGCSWKNVKIMDNILVDNTTNPFQFAATQLTLATAQFHGNIQADGAVNLVAANQRLFSGLTNTAPTDADIASSAGTFYLDETNNAITLRARTAAGVLFSRVGAIYLEGAGKTKLTDTDFLAAPPNGTIGTCRDTTSGLFYISWRTAGAWVSAQGVA